MSSRNSLVTTVTVTMTTTTSTVPLLEIDEGSDLQEPSQRKSNNAPTTLQRHFVYEPPPIPKEQHGHSKWPARSQHDRQEQYAVQKQHSRWPYEDSQSNYPKWSPGSHLQSNNNNTIDSNVISTSNNMERTFFNNNNSNYYNTNYNKDYDLSGDQFTENRFIDSLSPTSPSPLLMMVQEEEEELSDISGRGLKYPPPRRDSDGHIFGSANYSAPSPPERDFTLPYSSETIVWKKEKNLSPLSCEQHKDGSAWKEAFDLDPYMATNTRLSTTPMIAPVWKEEGDGVIGEKHSVSNSGYLSKVVTETPVTNDRNSRSLSNTATNRPYIVKPKPFYNTSTQTEETEVGYDSQLQFKPEETGYVSSTSVQSNMGFNSDKTRLEKSTQVQFSKTNLDGSKLVTLEQLRSPNHKEFIPASAPLLRRLTEEYYQMNINEDNKNESITVEQGANFDVDKHARNINKYDLHINKAATQNTNPEDNKRSFMSKTISYTNEPLQLSTEDKTSKTRCVNESLINVHEQMRPHIGVKMENINISNISEANTNVYDYKGPLKPSIINKKTSVRVNRPQPQFASDINVDSLTVKEHSFNVEEPRLHPFLGNKKNEYSKPDLQPQSYRHVDMQQNLNSDVSQPNLSKYATSGFNLKENQLRSYRSEPDYINLGEQVEDSNIPKMFDTVDDVFLESKGLPKHAKSDSRIDSQRQGVSVRFAAKTNEIPDSFRLQPMRTDSSNLKSEMESAQMTESNFVNPDLSHGSNPECLFRQKDNPESSVNQNANSKPMKDRHRLHPEIFLDQTNENVFSQSTESSECKYGTTFDYLLTQTREPTKSPLLKKYASTSDILIEKNPPVNSRKSVGWYENVPNQTRENIFMQKTVSGSSSEKNISPSQFSCNNFGIISGSMISKYPQSHFSCTPNVVTLSNAAAEESEVAKSDSLKDVSKQTAETEKKYFTQGFNTTKSLSVQQGTYDGAAKSSSVQQGTYDAASQPFENQSFIQHGRSESLPIDYTYESPRQHLRSYYSCTDVNKENRLLEPKSIYGVSDYMDMSGRHHTERSQSSSRITDDMARSSSFVPAKTKKKRTSSCTGYRIHANLESEEDPPPQLPPRAYRNMPENSSDNSSWIYESLRHRRSYANELRKQARRLNICKPLANITEAQITEVNQPLSGREYADKTNAVEKESGKREKLKILNENLNHDQNVTNAVEMRQAFKTDSKCKDVDMTNSTNIDEESIKYQQVAEDNTIKHVPDITEHSSNDKSYPNTNETSLNSNAILGSNVSQQVMNLDKQYSDSSPSMITNKPSPINNNTTNTSNKYRHPIVTDIDDINDSYESGVSPKDYNTDMSVKTFESVLQNETYLNEPFEPKQSVNEEQEALSVNEDHNMSQENQMYSNETCNAAHSNVNNLKAIDENVNLKKYVLYIDENPDDINEEKHPNKKEIVQLESPTDLSQSMTCKSMQPATSPIESELFIPSPTFQYSILKMPSFQTSPNRMQLQQRSSSEQCLTSIGSCNDQTNIPLYVSLGSIPTEEAGFNSADDKRNIDIVSVKQRIHFFEYDSNGQLVRNRIPPPVPAKPTSLVLRKKFPKEEGFSPTQPSPETDPSSEGKVFNLLTENPPEFSVNVVNNPEETSQEDKDNEMEDVQDNIKDNMDVAAASTSLLLPKAKECTDNLEYFQPSHVYQADHSDKDLLIRKKNALRDSLRRKLDVLREAKENVEAEIQEIDAMKKNICSQFENICPNVNECRKLTAFFKDREMCQVLLTKLKIRITRLKNEMDEAKPNPDLTDKLFKLQTQYSEAEQLSLDIDARQNSLVRLIEKYLTESNISDFNYLLTMRPRLVAEMFELNEKIYNGGEKLIELERVPYKLSTL